VPGGWDESRLGIVGKGIAVLLGVYGTQKHVHLDEEAQGSGLSEGSHGDMLGFMITAVSGKHARWAGGEHQRAGSGLAGNSPRN
jgi:hypothetical protein